MSDQNTLELPVEHQELISKATAQYKDMLTQHSPNIIKIKQDSESDAVSISFSIKFKGRKLKSKISYAGERNSDDREDEIDNPNQTKLKLK